MESSRTRNSILDWLLAASLALAVVVGLAGIDFTIAGANVRAHSVLRVLAGSAGLALLRYRLGITAAWPWLARLVLLTAICGSVLTWLRFLLGTIGGAESNPRALPLAGKLPGIAQQVFHHGIQ